MRNASLRGFTLIEMAIAMVIIGVILVAVLQGRVLIANAEYSSFKRSLNEYAEAFYAFRERFDALPGDFDEADSRLNGDATNGGGDGVIDGGPVCDSADEEACLAWQHLRYAGLIKGDPRLEDENASPKHPYQGVISGFFSGDHGNGVFGRKMLVTSVPGEVGRRIDREFDDGICDRGRISLRSIGSVSCAGSDGADWPDADAVDLVYAL